jgi:hypothetical protein
MEKTEPSVTQVSSGELLGAANTGGAKCEEPRIISRAVARSDTTPDHTMRRKFTTHTICLSLLSNMVQTLILE